jgi:hypothetical protein
VAGWSLWRRRRPPTRTPEPKPPVVTVSFPASASLNKPGNISAVLARDVNYALLFVRRHNNEGRQRRRIQTITFLLFSGLGACSTTAGPRATPDATASNSPAGIEDIYVLRSLRETRSAAAAFCDASKIGFTAKLEDRYLFEAVSTRPQDGKVVDARHP